MKHLWYCSRCNGVFFMPWLNNQNQSMGSSFNMAIVEVELECMICKAIKLFRRVPE